MGYRPRRDIAIATVRVVVGDHCAVANARNVSASGLRIETAFDAEVGDPVLIQLRDKTFSGHIVWMKDDATGVTFGTPLRQSDLALFTGRPDRTQTPARKRVGFAGHPALRR